MLIWRANWGTTDKKEKLYVVIRKRQSQPNNLYILLDNFHLLIKIFKS